MLPKSGVMLSESDDKALKSAVTLVKTAVTVS